MKQLRVWESLRITFTVTIAASRLLAVWVGRSDFLPMESNNTSAKNGTARLIPLEGELVQLIERRKTARQFKANGLVMMSALIFHRAGEPIGEFRKSWATACRLVGVRRLFHDLRRSACQNMVAAGVAQVTAMQLSGHKTDSMFRRYAIVAENDMRAALRMTQNHLASLRKELVAAPTRVN